MNFRMQLQYLPCTRLSSLDPQSDNCDLLKANMIFTMSTLRNTYQITTSNDITFQVFSANNICNVCYDQLSPWNDCIQYPWRSTMLGFKYGGCLVSERES